MAVNVVTLTVDAGDFAKVTPGVIKQIRQVLQRETTKVIVEVARKQAGEKFLTRVDNRWGKPINQAERLIQAFWAFPADGEILAKAKAIIDEETYRHPTRRTGTLGRSWLAYFKSADQRRAGGPGRLLAAFPKQLPPGSGVTFINVAKYGSLMSRWSAVAALKGSIARSAAKAKPNQEFKGDRRITKLTKTILYQATPKGYSTAARISARVRRFSSKVPLLIRAFDVPGKQGLIRAHGLSITVLRGISQADVIKQGRAR